MVQARMPGPTAEGEATELPVVDLLPARALAVHDPRHVRHHWEVVEDEIAAVAFVDPLLEQLEVGLRHLPVLLAAGQRFALQVLHHLHQVQQAVWGNVTGYGYQSISCIPYMMGGGGG